MNPTDPLERLRQDRLLALMSIGLTGDHFSAVAVRQRCAAARAYGRTLAADHLTWQQVTQFRGMHDEVQRTGDRWVTCPGPHMVESVAGHDLATRAPIHCFGSWAAFLAGVEEVAQAAER